MGFSRQEYWNGWPFPSPRALPDPGIEPGSLTLSVQFSSVAQLCPTLGDPMNCSTAGLPAAAAAAAAKSLQSCLTLCNPIDGSPPGSAVPRILQAGKLEWITISFSNV